MNEYIKEYPDGNYLIYDDKAYKVNIRNYPNGSLAMGVILTERGMPDEYQHVVTVNLGNFSNEEQTTFVQLGSSFFDANMPYAEEMINVLLETGLAKPYTRYGEEVWAQSGYVAYPLLEFDKDMLAELNEIEYKQYETIWTQNMLVEQEKLNKEMSGDFGGYYEDETEEEMEI